jgi:thiol-disulfide isomerase/thioredoxin
MPELSFLGRILLALVFGLAGVAKLLDFQGSRKSLTAFGMPRSLTAPFAVFLPMAELACSIALLVDALAWRGAIGVSVLLAAFTAAIGINLLRGRAPDCHCFGQLSSSPVSWKTLARNAALLVVAGVLVWQGPEHIGKRPAFSGWSSWGWTSFEMSMLAVTVVLAAGLLLSLWFQFHMLKQNGRLLLRLEAVEKKLGIEPGLAVPPGLPVGAPAPAYQSVAGPEKRAVLIFTEPGCGTCEALKPDIARWQSEYAHRLNFVPMTDRELRESFQVKAVPSAVFVVDGLIASPLAEGADAIRALVSKSTLPPPVKRGEPVPSLPLPDLNGATVDLGSLRGRRTLVLFWSPVCGFCQQMMQDLKQWERRRPQHAPELLIVSSGSVEENRKQGFDSLVLLDQNFGAGNVLGAGGTPSAVIIDEQGMVASEVRVGASEVLALAAS